MIKRRTRWGILALTLVAFASWLVSKGPADQARKRFTGIDTQLNYVLHDFEGRLLDDQGKISLEISSPALRKNAESEVGTVDKPVIRIQQEN